MIRRWEDGRHFIEGGGLTVFFCSAERGEAYVRLYNDQGGLVALVDPRDRGGKARVRELEDIGLLKVECPFGDDAGSSE